FMIALAGRSLNSKYPPLRDHTGPSANWRFPTIFSMVAPGGTSLSTAGSRRWTPPTPADWAASGSVLAHINKRRIWECFTDVILSEIARRMQTELILPRGVRLTE